MKVDNLQASPLISVAIATHNGEEFIERCLNSILKQSFKEYEIIISDDNSQDGTQDILEKFADLHSFIHVYKQEKNIGEFKQKSFLLNKSKVNSLSS